MQTIPSKLLKKVGIVYAPRATAICEVSGVPFSCQLEITYVPRSRLLEFEAFEAWLKEDVSKMPFTVESLAVFIYNHLRSILPDLESLIVCCRAETIVHGPVEVTVLDD